MFAIVEGGRDVQVSTKAKVMEVSLVVKGGNFMLQEKKKIMGLFYRNVLRLQHTDQP